MLRDDGDASDAMIFLDGPRVGKLAERLTPRGERLDLLGLDLLAMPPGEVMLDAPSIKPMLNVIPDNATELRLARMNGVDMTSNYIVDQPSFDLFAPLERLELDCTNPHWEVLVELDAERLPLLSAEASDGRWSFDRLVQGGGDAAIVQLGRLAIDHLRFGDPDRLYAESLAVAMTARAMALCDARVRPVPARGTDTRIARATDHAEAHLGEALSIAELAAVANMSPSWFRDCFRAATGTPVHAYVRERRLQRARRLLTDAPRAPLGTRPSIQQVAHACGFTDQSHLTRAFKRRFGVTPGEARDG